MSEFFESDIVRKELDDIYQLQKRLQKVFLTIPSLSSEEKREFLKLTLILIDKQEIMYFRMKLSEDPKSKEMLDEMKKSAIILGISEDVSLDELFGEMRKTMKSLSDKLDKEDDM
jgi:predicted site-specific integrase-resolvase